MAAISSRAAWVALALLLLVIIVATAFGAGAFRSDWRGLLQQRPAPSPVAPFRTTADGAPSLPSNLEEAIPRTHGGTKFQHDQKIGLYWELYGRAPADSALPISLTITPVDESLLPRPFRALRIAPRLSPINFRWQENGASGVLSARSVLLDLSLVPAGKYAVKLEVGNAPAAMTQRVIEVK